MPAQKQEQPAVYFQTAATGEYVAPDGVSTVVIRKPTGADDLERDVLLATLAREDGGDRLTVTPAIARELLWHEARLTFVSWTFVDAAGQVPPLDRETFESLPEDVLIGWQQKIWELAPHWGPESPPSRAGETN